jgi:hypothetical protein
VVVHCVGVGTGGVPCTGVWLKIRFCETLSMGMSKLGVFVRLKTSKLYLRANRSDNCVTFKIEMSAFRCHDCRKMLRCPEVKLVSNVSPAGIALFRSPGLSNGTVKQAAFRAGTPGVAPFAPVRALLAVQPGASGTIGFVIPS